ncbi:MAG: hypothetical protein JW966_16365 [Anaerolineae bacterium]|nr:hypothetical protein [Anaerolineae bacterium]
MSLPPLKNWDGTRISLHQSAQVLGAVRAAIVRPEPNDVHLGLRVVPEGLTTGDLPGVGEMLLTFRAATILYKPPQKEPAGFSLMRHHQVSLTDAVNHALQAFGHTIILDREKLAQTTVFEIDPAAADGYAGVLNLMVSALNRVRDSLPGEKTPPVVWPDGFDLSFLWFATSTTSEKAPHMNFGFSPFSAGLDRPYVFAYPHPVPEGVVGRDLPPLAHWHTTGWTGAVIPYDALVNESEPDRLLENSLRKIYATLSPLLLSNA